MEDEEERGGRSEKAGDFVVWIVGAVIGASVCRWLSNLTAGREYGGRYDIPGVNYASWFAFVLFSAAVILGVVGGALRLLGALWLRVAGKRR